MKIIKLQGIKFCMNDSDIVLFTHCYTYCSAYLAQIFFFFPKILLPRESIFLPVQSKEDYF